MSWTFGNDPLNSRLDRIRILIGDTEQSEPLLSDEEILWILDQELNDYRAAAKAAKLLAARFARQADISVGELSAKFADLSERFLELADALASEAMESASPNIDTSILTYKPKEPLFRRRQFDYDG